MFALQDSYSNAMKPLGLERGQRESKATHTSVKKYYSVVNEFCDSSVGSEIDNLKSQFADLKSENAQLKQQLSQSIAEMGGLRKQYDELLEQLDESVVPPQSTAEQIAQQPDESGVKPRPAAELIAQQKVKVEREMYRNTRTERPRGGGGPSI